MSYYQEVLDLTTQVQWQDGRLYPVACGGNADVYRALLSGRDVAVKVIRATGGGDIERVCGIPHRPGCELIISTET